MKKHRAMWFVLCLAITVGLGFASPTSAADPQTIAGTWGGMLDPGARPKKRILVHIYQAQDGTLSGAIDYPDQDTSGIQITAITYKEPTLHFESSSSLSAYDGTMNKDHSEIAGSWKEGGTPLNLILRRTP